jgi:polyphosphate kinase
VRGFCCLKPGVPGLSENISVSSVIGRFLEHSRIFYFHNQGDSEYYIGSADWMYRNLNNRVECITPILDPALRRRLKNILDVLLADQRQAWDMQADGSYVQRKLERYGESDPAADEEESMSVTAGTHELLMADARRAGDSASGSN